MKTRSIIGILVIGLFILSACSGGSGSSGPKRVWTPDWWAQQGDPEYIYTYGSAERVSQNAAESAAYALAMQEAAQYVQAHVQGMIKNFVEESGYENPQVLQMTSNVARVVSNSEFSGTRINKRETIVEDNGRYKHFVQVSIPAAQVNKNMMNQIKNEEAMYNRFRASQAFDDLDKQLGN